MQLIIIILFDVMSGLMSAQFVIMTAKAMSSFEYSCSKVLLFLYMRPLRGVPTLVLVGTWHTIHRFRLERN